MKAYKVTVNVRLSENGNDYIMTGLESPCSEAWLCREVYEQIIGKEVVGEVTFILRKIKGKATDYVFPFRIKDCSLDFHDGKGWEYAKWMDIIGHALNEEELTEWAGKSMFSIEMEY